MDLYRRRLPHWTPAEKDLFITWRLHGSLPAHRFVPPEGLTSGQAFAWIDSLLDRATHGPSWMPRPAVAQFIVGALQYGDRVLKHYELHAYVVMPNHVHLLISPLVEVPNIMHSLKGFTAREANRMLGRTGVPFWQREAYDRWIRVQKEFEKVKVYIERNPVAAGLAATPQQYRWSSATAEKKAGEDAGSPPRLAAPRSN